MKLTFTFILATALAVAAAQECPVFLANGDGMVFIDAEQRGSGGGWEYRTEPAEFQGSGVLSYKPDSSFGGTEWKPSNFMDERIKAYHFTVNEPGVYRVMLRSSAPHPTEHNDLWMSLPESGSQMTKDGFNMLPIADPVPGDQMWAENVPDNVWFKVYQNQGGDSWNVGGYTLDFDPHTILTMPLLADNTWYSVRIAGRSTQFDVDRIIIFKCEDTECAYSGLRYGVAKAYIGPQSECGSTKPEVESTEENTEGSTEETTTESTEESTGEFHSE